MPHHVPQGGREVWWESTGPMTPTCRRMGVQITGMTRVVAAAGAAGLMASRLRRALGRSITPTCVACGGFRGGVRDGATGRGPGAGFGGEVG
jgi:hypothetical protein